MAQIIAQRTTSQSITTENRLVRAIGEEIGLLEPQIAPMVTLIMRMKKRRKVTSPIWEFMEDDFRARWGRNSTTTIGNTTSANTITVLDGTIFAEGDLFMVPKAVTSSTAPEIVRVISISTNVLTVQRAAAGSTIDTINASDAFRLIGMANEEGGTLPRPRVTSPVTYTTYTAIWKTVIDFSNTQIASKLYGSQAEGERKRQHKKQLQEHKETMNAALLWSSASQALTGGPNSKPIRTTMGVNSRITTNVTDGGGMLTETLFDAWARQAFRYGKSEKILLASPIMCSAINAWAKRHLLVKPAEKVYGVNIQEVQTAHGVWLLVRDWGFESAPAGSNGLNGISFSLDIDQLEYIWLSDNGENRDTKIMQDVVQDGADRKVDQILTEGGFVVGQEKYHSKLFNVTNYQS